MLKVVCKHLFVEDEEFVIIKDENGLNAEAISAFKHTTVNVEGANGYSAKSYNVYYKDNAEACNKANNWVVTLG